MSDSRLPLNLPRERKFKLAEPCRKECLSYQQPRYYREDIPVEVIKGNAAFMYTPLKKPDYYISRGFDRLIFQPRLPN